MKLCVIYNFAQHYRTAIFRMISETYDCDFYFGENRTDIKGIDFSQIQGKCSTLKTYENKWFKYYYGTINLLFKKYDVYLVLGEERCLSTWLLLLLSKLFPKKKIYLWSHGKYGKEGKVKTFVQRVFFGLADGTFLYGNYAKKIMIESGFNSQKLFVIKNSLDYDRQLELRKKAVTTSIYVNHFNNRNKVLLFIGRLTEVKKLDMLLNSLKNLNDLGRKFNLVLVGDGIEKEKLIEQSVRLGIEEQVWFYGACYDEEKNVELIYNADLCVAPGNVGLTAMHTMVFGTPVLSHDNFSWQMPEFEAIHPGKTGLFFKYQNQNDLTQSIIKWFDIYASSREAIRIECYKEIDNYWNPYYQMKILTDVIG